MVLVEVLDGNEERAIRHWRKGNTHYKVTEHVDELGSTVLLQNETFK